VEVKAENLESLADSSSGEEAASGLLPVPEQEVQVSNDEEAKRLMTVTSSEYVPIQ